MVTRREFLAEAAVGVAVAAGTAIGLPGSLFGAGPTPPRTKSRVVVIRHEALAAEDLAPRRVRDLLDEAAKALVGESGAADAWARWFRPDDRLGIKVNCLGYATHPAVAQALAEAVGAVGLPPQEIILWDRTGRELQAAGYTLRESGPGVRCLGTDALASRGNAGYAAEIATSGSIGSLYSRIITDETNTLVSACVLKDHGLAGLTCSLKNFFGAIHNPNKYHGNNCDPFVADVCAHALIRDRLRLVVCDAMHPQYHGGPARRAQWQWPYGGLILSTDPVAVDGVAREILVRRRAAAKMKPLEAEGRPVRYLATAQARGLGTADLDRIEIISIGKTWTDLE